MRAIIMAGGEGSRLRPLTLARPKPMLPLLGRPVLARLLELLRRHGITDVCMTLGYLPDAVRGYFGSGAAFGMRIEYRVEREPLGTAGGVRACRDFIGGEDFLVISGDGVCDFDLSACAAFHRAKEAEATLVLAARSDPLEYGLVLTDAAGRVTRFVEKPGWGEVRTDLVNTGVYFLRPSVLDIVPENASCDFGRDVFPALLARGAALYACRAEGYWCDVGDAAAYLACTADALSRRAGFSPAAPERAPGIWSAAPLPDGAVLRAPCYLDERVSVAPGAVIGPHAALLAGTSVGARARVERSIVEASSIAPGAALYGAILAPGCVVRRGARLAEGCVLGARAVVGEGAAVEENVRVWPGRAVADGARQRRDLLAGSLAAPLRFAEGGALGGAWPMELGPDAALALGAALGTRGAVAVASGAGSCETALAELLAAGVRAAGGFAVRPDCASPAANAWFVRERRLAAGVFAARTEEGVRLTLAGPDGLPPPRAEERRIELALAHGEREYACAAGVGQQARAARADRQYALAAAAAARRDFPGGGTLAVAAEGERGAKESLEAALRAIGCTLLRPAAGVPLLRAGRGGARLEAEDEYGEAVPAARLLGILCMMEFRWGSGTAAVPETATALADAACARWNGKLLRIGVDAGARELYAAQPHLRDAVFAAARLCACLRSTGATLRALDRALPPLFTAVRELPLPEEGRARAMRRAAEQLPGSDARVCVRGEEGTACAYPLARRAAVRIVAEAASAELAAELCAQLEAQLRGGARQA